MKIINDHTFDGLVLAKEGILVFNAFVFESLLENYPEVEISILTDNINIPELNKVYKRCIEKYPTRFSLNIVNRERKITLIEQIRLRIKLSFHSLFKKSKVEKIKQKLFNKSLLSMQEALSKHVVKGDILFSSALAPNYPYYWKGPHVFLLHDLFTIPLADRFRKAFPNIDEMNQNSVQKINDFSERGTFFVNTSEYTRREQLLKYTNVPKERTAVIPFPPLIKDFDEMEISDEANIKEKYHIPGQYIFYPSQNRPNKNWGVIFKALARLKKKGISLFFVTTGQVATLEDDAKLVKDLGIEDLIIETGIVSSEDRYALYKYADLVVASTIIEGPGISEQALEAMKVGIPVIHAKSLGIEESLAAAGLTMAQAPLNWFDLDDDETLSEKIHEVLGDPKTHIQNQRVVLDAYLKRTWKEVADSYMKIFNQEIKKGGK